MKKIYLSLVVLCAFVMAYLPSIAQDAEPNDNAFAAKPLGLNMMINGTMFPMQADTVDWYRVEIANPGAVNIECIPIGMNMDVILQVYTSNDNGVTTQLLETSDVGIANQMEKISNPSVQPGLYYVVVILKQGQGMYSLKLDYTQEQPTNPVLSNLFIDDFEDEDLVSLQGNEWGVITDNSSGGNSSANIYLNEYGLNNSIGALRVQYFLDKASLPYDPFILARINLQANAQPVNVSAAQGIRLDIENPEIVKIQLVTANVTDYAYYEYVVNKNIIPSNLVVPFSSFTQPVWGSPAQLDLTQLVAIQIQTVNTDGTESYFVIDNIEIYANQTQPSGFVLDDFSDGDLINNLGGGWYKYEDSQMGGGSVLQYSLLPENTLQATYTLEQGSLNFDPFVLVGTMLNGQNTSVDITGSTGITFTYQGRDFFFDVIDDIGMAGENYQIHIPGATEPKTVTILWSQLNQPSWATNKYPLNLSIIKSFQWRIQAPSGTSGVINIDDVTILNYQTNQSQDSVDVTFSVNMKNQTVSPHGVRLNGSFINWETSQAIPMQYVGNDVYTTTVKLPVGAVIQYKFINGTGDDYAAYEVINQGCADPMYGNRVLTVSSTNKVLPLVCFASCTDCIESGGVNVTIMTNQNVGSAPLLVEFTGMSLSNIITWNWEFGDGYYSQGQTTMHQYNNPGVYTAILRVLDDKGVAGMTTATITVNSASYLSPYISVDRNSGFVPFVSNFSGNCTGNIVSWMWDFGDGTTGSGQYVSHSYTQEGIYIVTLNVLDDTGKTGSYYIYITATKPSNTLKTEFWAQNYANYAPFTVNFGDYSDGGPTEWYWDFQNDGIIDSYEQNPTYVYQNPGYYSVKLIIKNAQGYIDSLVKYNFIEVWQPIQIENYCEKAVPAQLGSNYFDFATANSSHFGQPMKWYSYTATSNKLLKIDLCNSGYNHWQEVFDIYINCEGTYANDIKRNFCNMSQNSVFPVQDGQTIYFSIVCEGGVNGEKGLTFELTEMPILPGSICSFAKTATVGTNNATTVAGDDWFEFVVPNDGYYEVSTCGKTTLDTDVEIYKSCNSYSWLSSSNDCGLQSKVMFHASQAETLKIVWRDFNSKGQFPWEIKYLGTQIVYPEFSVSNNMGVDSALVYFYNNSVNAISYAWDFNNDGVVDSNVESPAFVYMQPGIYTVKLQITGYEGAQLVTKTIVKPDYILVQKSPQTGTYCQLAKQAVIGNNTMSMVDGTTQWFKYTSDFEGKLVIQTCNSNYPLDIYIYDMYDDCNNHRVYGSNTMCGNKTTQYLDVVPGKTYYFNMMIYSYVSGINTVNFELIKQLPQPGDLCGLPIILQSSSIQSIQKPVGNIGSANVEKWYSFTAPYNGVAEINTCINQDLGMINAELFNTCNMNDYNNYPDYDYRECQTSNYGYSSGAKVVQMVKDQTILIKVSGSVSQVAQWQFVYRDYYAGEVCTKPLLAKQGVNSNPSGLTEIFYTYTAQDNGVVNVSNCQYVSSSAQYSGVQVRTSCDKETGEIVQYGAANCNGSYGADIAFQVEKGKTYIIQWFTHAQNWNLDFIKDAVLPPGYTCQNPIVISQEQTVVQPTGNITWLELSYPQSGTVSLSSNLNIEANVFLFDVCTPLSENLKSTVPYLMMDSAIVFWPQANKKYKMLIVFSEQAPTMPYTIQSKYLSNQSQPANVVCADAKPLSLGAQQTTTVYGNYWYSYNAKANTIVHLDFNNEQFQQLQIWPSIYFSCPSPFDSHGGGYYNNVFMPCGNNLQGITMPIEKDTTLYIQFRSRNLSTTVNWTLNEYSTKSVAITSFSSMQQVSNAVINSITRTINLTVAQSASISETTIDFKVSPGATIKTSSGITLCPGSQLFFNNGTTTITVTSADGTVSQNWIVNIVKSTVVSNKAEIVGLYSSVLKDVQINSVTNTVTATVPYFIQDCYQMDIQVSAGAMVMNPLQTQCFDGSNPMIRTVQVKAEDGTTIKTWTINFVREAKPVGADCDKLATAVKGYNTIPFAQYQDTYFMEYTMENNGTFEVDACTSNMMLGAYIILDCETIDNSALLTYCKDPNFASKSQKEYTKGQKVKIAVFRVSENSYPTVSGVMIREIPSVITNFVVNPAQPTVYLNDTVYFNLQVLPLQNFVANITSSTSGSVLQKVSNTSYKALQLGTQNVVFTTTDGSNITKTIPVTVVPKPILVSQIVLPSALTLTVGQVNTIPAIISPNNATNKGVTWAISNTSIASIDQYGTIEAKSLGTVTVTATALDAGKVVSNNCVVTIQGVDATAVTVNKTALTLKVGEVFTALQATVLPINATDKALTWTSSNPGIVTVVNNALYAFAPGTSVVTIALTSNPTIKATVSVTVTSTAVVVDKTILATRISSYENTVVAIISQNLVGNNSGQYPQVALATFTNNLDEANFLLTNPTATQEQVNQMIVDLDVAMKAFQESRIDKILIAYINIKREVIPCVKGEQKQLYVEILPTNASFTEINYTSDNALIASVSQTGLITANSVGETYVYARSKDGSGNYDSVKVVVTIPLLSISLPQSISLVQGNTVKLEPVRNPIDAPIDSYTWTSEDNTVATVDNFGNVKGLKKGAVTISVIETKSGKTASTVVYVQEQTIAVTGIEIIRDTIKLPLGKSDIIYPYIKPYNATNQSYSWSTSNNSLQLSTTGVITAVNVNSGYVYVTTAEGNFKDSVYIKVISSEPPVVKDIEVVMEKGSSQVEVPLQSFVKDDNTAIEYLTVSVVSSTNFTASVQNGAIVIQPVNPSIPITEVVQVKVTDIDNLSTTVEIPVTISGTPNQAPTFEPEVVVTLNSGTSFAPIVLQDLVQDDYTAASNLTYEIVTPSQNFITYVSNGVLDVTRIDANWVGKDSVEVKVTDGAGLSTTKFIVLEVSQALNQAPVLNSIPAQTYNVTTARYPSLDLKKYVKDDYTPASAIEWTFTPNSKLLITIVNGVASILSADKNWVGTTQVTFTAFDQDGLSASTVVSFTQPATGSSTWMALPKISFSASQTIVGPGAPVSFTSSMSGAESWIWEFEGLNLTPQQRIVPNPVVSYSKGGKYKVTLKAMNQYGADSLVKVDYITVIGINKVNPIVCYGSSVTLEATVPASAGYSYVWSTGENSQSITVQPTANTTYSLTVYKGFFQYEDAVSLQVPVKVSLPADRAICQGSAFPITVPNFVEYNWNNQGWGTQNSIVVNQAGTTHLQVRDSYGCVTSDDFTITEVYALPTVSLGDDKQVCQGSSTTLSPTVTGNAPFTYTWNTNANSQTLSVNADGNYSVEVTDKNGCKASDEVAVAILRPHKEEIGVATFAKDGKGVVIAWERTLGKRTASYEVMRETGESGTYISVGTLPFNAPESFIEDKDADVLTKSFTYKLITRDSTCNNTAESAPHTTVVVAYNVSQITGKATLQWSKYVGLPIATYRIKKGTNVNNLVQVDSVSGSAAPMWNDPVPYQFGTIYRVEMKLPDTVETRWEMLKIESGPFTLALSNIAEAQTSIQQVSDVSMKVYPTIATSQVSIDFDAEMNNVTIQLVSSSGTVVYSSVVSGNSFTIPLSGVAKGVYSVKVIVNSQVQTIPIVVQ